MMASRYATVEMGLPAYGDAVAVYLGFLVSKLADKGSALCTWDAGPVSNRTASGRSARVATVRVPLVARRCQWRGITLTLISSVNRSVGVETVLKTLSVPLTHLVPSWLDGKAQQSDAQSQELSRGAVVSTDPPDYHNIGYADLSDFFYVWLRRSLRPVFSDLFTTVDGPKPKNSLLRPSARREGRGARNSSSTA